MQAQAGGWLRRQVSAGFQGCPGSWPRGPCILGRVAARRNRVHRIIGPITHERSSPDHHHNRFVAGAADNRRTRARGQEPKLGTRPVLARRFQVRHEGHEGRGARPVGRKRQAAPACGSTIPATANRAVTSRRAPSGAGWRKVLAFSPVSPRARRSSIGSSMGGWLALLLARALSGRKDTPPIAGMVLIAPAVDFTEELMWKQFSAATKREIEEKGVWMRPSDYGEEPYPITRGLIEDGRKHLLLGGLIETALPRAYFARRAGSGRAVAARGRTGVALLARRRRADADQGRRSSAVAAGRHRAADRGGEGILI